MDVINVWSLNTVDSHKITLMLTTWNNTVILRYQFPHIRAHEGGRLNFNASGVHVIAEGMQFEIVELLSVANVKSNMQNSKL